MIKLLSAKKYEVKNNKGKSSWLPPTRHILFYYCTFLITF